MYEVSTATQIHPHSSQANENGDKNRTAPWHRDLRLSKTLSKPSSLTIKARAHGLFNCALPRLSFGSFFCLRWAVVPSYKKMSLMMLRMRRLIIERRQLKNAAAKRSNIPRRKKQLQKKRRNQRLMKRSLEKTGKLRLLLGTFPCGSTWSASLVSAVRSFISFRFVVLTITTLLVECSRHRSWRRKNANTWFTWRHEQQNETFRICRRLARRIRRIRCCRIRLDGKRRDMGRIRQRISI